MLPMPMKFAVEQASDEVAVPPHPIEGPMDAGGSIWIADQYTLRLLRDGVIRHKPDDDQTAPLPAVPTSASSSATNTVALATPAAVKPAAAVAGVKE